LKIFKSTDVIPFDGTAITVGTFDGIHHGHQIIINKVKEQAKILGVQSLLFTFEPHPKTVVFKQGVPDIRLLTTIDEKIEVLETTGLDSLYVSLFDKTFAATTAEEFVRETLVKRLKMKSIIIGHDHAFGRNRQGNDELLARLGQELGFQVHTIEQISNENERISSTRIRHALHEGQADEAARMLGRSYSVSGTVIHGLQQGRELGFPTANLRPDSPFKLIPKVGIYATRVRIDNKIHNSVTYIGVRPTFDGTHKVVEVHVMDFDGTIYGQNITVYFEKFLRDDRRFASTDELVKNIQNDKNNAITYFANGG
jgi:riboflavin kinase/FMN adenylyltransferase